MQGGEGIQAGLRWQKKSMMSPGLPGKRAINHDGNRWLGVDNPEADVRAPEEVEGPRSQGRYIE